VKLDFPFFVKKHRTVFLRIVGARAGAIAHSVKPWVQSPGAGSVGKRHSRYSGFNLTFIEL
jgi:hypothetical protein